MSRNWGPHYIVPSDTSRKYSGDVLLREDLDEELLMAELAELGFKGRIDSISNPWYYRTKNDETWIMIGESHDRQRYFPVRWDTRKLPDGRYELMGMMHAFIEDDEGGPGKAIARESIVEITVDNSNAEK